MKELREIEALAAEMKGRASYADDLLLLELVERLAQSMQLLRNELGLD
jgi:hypothetical protein